MTNDKKVNVAIIGTGFGAEFIPIYQKHPNANMYGVCRRNESELNKVADAFGIEKRFTDYNDVLNDQNVDFVRGWRRPAESHEACFVSSAFFVTSEDPFAGGP